MPDEWKKNSVLTLIYKNKGEIQDCGNSRRIKLVTHNEDMGKNQIEDLGTYIALRVIDLEKAYDRVPREEEWNCLRLRGATEKFAIVMECVIEDARREATWDIV
ncbi:uncharacterized protein LOC134783484 [Penaeus indicus]|uniref:uncharacterized protein LOC134783484 n=1 Tax=Penaeus indicus TaxID=29960 RepID=UPI00300C2B6D